MMAGKSSRLAILLDLDGSKFEKGLNRSLSRFRNASKKMQTAGRNLSVGLSAPLAIVGASSFKVAADFELAMAKVAAVSGGGGDALAKLTDQAKTLGGSTSFSASQVSELQLSLSKLGFGVSDLTGSNGLPGMTNSVLNLSKAFDTELGETADVVGATLRQFGLDASDTEMVTDVMAKSFASSALDLNKFGESMKNAGPVANEFGFSLSETSSLLGVLANNGISGADAGTKLKMAFSELAKSGVPVKETFTKLLAGGVSYTEAIDTLGTRAAILGPIFGKNLESLSELQTQLDDSAGTAQSMSDVMGNTTAGSLAEMQSAIEAAQIEIGTALAPTILEVTEIIRDMAASFAALDDDTKRTIVQIAGAAAALGPLLIVSGKVTGAVGGLTKSFRLMREAGKLAGTTGASSFAKLAGVLTSGPFLAVAGAVVALGIALAPVIKHFTSMEHKARSVAGATREMNKAVAEEKGEVKGLFTQLKLAAKGERDRGEAIAEIQSKYGAYLGNLDLNKASLEEIADAEERVTKAMSTRVRAQMLAEAQKKVGEAQTTIEKILIDFELEASEDGFKVEDIVNFSKGVRALSDELAMGQISQKGFFDGIKELEEKGVGGLHRVFANATDSGGLFGTRIENAVGPLDRAAKAAANMQKVVDNLDGTMSEAGKEGETLDELFARLNGTTVAATKSTKTHVDTTSKLGNVIADLAKGLTETQRIETVFGEGFGTRDTDRLSELKKAIESIVGEDLTGAVDVGALKLTTEQLAALGAVLGEDFGGDAQQILTALANAVKSLSQETTNTETPLEALRSKMAELQTFQRVGLIDGMEAAQSALTALETALSESLLSDPTFEGSDKFKEMTAEIERMREALAALGVDGEAVEETTKKFDKLAAAQQATTDLANAAVDAIFDKETKFLDSAKSIAKGLIKQALSTAIANAIASAFSPASPDNIATGGAAAPVKALANKGAAAALFASIPAFAQGGAVMGGRGGTLALIGENPASRGEFIVPFEKLGQFMGMAGGQQNDIHTRIQGDTLEISTRRAGRGLSRRSVL